MDRLSEPVSNSDLDFLGKRPNFRDFSGLGVFCGFCSLVKVRRFFRDASGEVGVRDIAARDELLECAELTDVADLLGARYVNPVFELLSKESRRLWLVTVPGEMLLFTTGEGSCSKRWVPYLVGREGI